MSSFRQFISMAKHECVINNFKHICDKNKASDGMMFVTIQVHLVNTGPLHFPSFYASPQSTTESRDFFFHLRYEINVFIATTERVQSNKMQIISIFISVAILFIFKITHLHIWYRCFSFFIDNKFWALISDFSGEFFRGWLVTSGKQAKSASLRKTDSFEGWG